MTITEIITANTEWIMFGSGIILGYAIKTAVDYTEHELIGEIKHMTPEGEEKISWLHRITLYIRKKSIEKKIKRLNKKNFGEKYRNELIESIMTLIEGENPVFEEIEITTDEGEKKILVKEDLEKMSTKKLIESSTKIIAEIEKMA